MPFQPEIKEEVFKIKKIVGQEKYTVNLSINSEQKISQVLSVGAKSCVSANNVMTGAVVVDGKICSKAIVTDIDNQFKSIESTNTFSFNFSNSNINSDSIIFSTSKLVEINNIQATDSNLTFSAIILITIYHIVEQKVTYINDINKIHYQKKGEVEYSNIVSTNTKEFDSLNEVELPNNIGSIIQVESNAILSNIDVSNDVVTLEGKIYANLVYLTNEEKPRLKNQNYLIDFNQEVLCNDVTSNCQAFATLESCCTNYEVQGELNSAKGVLIIKSSLRTNIFVNEQKNISAVVDLFCPKYELNTSTNSFVRQNNKYVDVINEKIDGNIVISNEDIRVDRVLATISNVVVSDVSIQNELNINGKLYTNVVYQLDDDPGTIGSVLAEIPFNFEIKSNEIDNADVLSVDVMVTDLEARNKRSKEIDIIADVSIFVNVDREINEAILSDVKLGEKLDIKYSPMGLYYINEAEDLWDIAKYLKLSPEKIMQQNPDLKFPITKSTKIIVYRERDY